MFSIRFNEYRQIERQKKQVMVDKNICWEKCKILFVEKFSIKNNNVFYKVMAHNVR